jgi:hypothetical protein
VSWCFDWRACCGGWRRATGIETALFEAVTDELSNREPGYPGLTFVARADPAKGDQSRITRSDAAVGSEPSLDQKKDIGEVFLRLAALSIVPLDRLSRYEYMLWRQARQVVLTLVTSQRCTRVRKRPALPLSFWRHARGRA